jgi:signal transduction histidine kinase
MKAEAADSWKGRLVPTSGGILSILITPIRRFPARIRERRFWEVQALLLVATVPHYALEALGYTNPAETMHSVAITLYILPLLYAALNYGWEGALLTGIWAAVLTSPSIWVWHRGELHWLAELGQISVTLAVGLIVAWRVDLESKQRQRAEQTSGELRLLNEIADILSHTLEVERELPEVLRRLQRDLSLECVSLCLEPESSAENDVTLTEAADAKGTDGCLGEELRRRLEAKTQSAVVEDKTLVIPLLGETGLLGLLGVKAAEGSSLGDARVELLATVAQQVRVAVENARLYRLRQESLESYARQVTQAQEDERLRIARELHDETAQELVQLTRRIEQLQDHASPELDEEIEQLLSMTRGTIQAVRRYSRDLRPSVLDDLGLRAAIELVVEDAGQRLHSARLEVSGDERRLDGAVELALFRIAQEALRNVEKHSEATTATVDLDFGAREITLAVTDNGTGFSATGSAPDLIRIGKLGLVGMKERCELVGGTLELQSSLGTGTRIVVRVPTP